MSLQTDAPNEADTDEGLTDDKPFSPMYPVFNFAAPNTESETNFQHQPPPAYSQSDYSEKRL